MNSSTKNTNINWITTLRKGEDEWCGYKKIFYLDKAVDNAVIRFESDCICAVYVNGEFIISGTGRYPERVNCHEVTSKLLAGNNTIEILLGGHYFQQFAYETRKQRGYWLNQAALELEINFTDGEKLNIFTDDSWLNTNSEEKEPVIKTMQVTCAEYDTMWKNAALWKETQNYTAEIPSEVLSVVGEDYENYANKKRENAECLKEIVLTNMKCEDGAYIADGDADECCLIADMGRIVVGYVEFEYNSNGDVFVESMFDVSENPEDFELKNECAPTVKRLITTDKLKKGKNFYRNLRRRAFRYIKLTFKGDIKDFSVQLPAIRLCLFPGTTQGWFNCSDDMLSKAWEMGKYTLHVNKQQEYESCPRCEMLFFAGDGALDALIDMYAFGNCEMLNTSLSVKHEEKAIGISSTQKFNRTVWQWDYFAWRIICIYNYYRHTGDIEFLKRHYTEVVNNILWLRERMNDKNLLFQLPAFLSTFSSVMIQVDWACSVHRLGENAFLNCLLYKSFLCMSELALDMNDNEKSDEWKELAQNVKEAINTYLWSEEKQAYVDGISEYICQDANALAVIFGVADKERALTALNTLKEQLWSEYGSVIANVELKNGVLRGGNTTISPMMSAREAEAWFIQERAEEGLELIRRVWGTMIKKGATTFWEFSPNNSEERWEAPCHAWSAGCTYLLSAFVLGVRPLASNWEKIIFAPRPCDIESGKGVIPTPHGFIASSWRKNDNGKTEFKIAVPNEIEIELNLPQESSAEVINY